MKNKWYEENIKNRRLDKRHENILRVEKRILSMIVVLRSLNDTCLLLTLPNITCLILELTLGQKFHILKKILLPPTSKLNSHISSNSFTNMSEEIFKTII